MSQEIGSVITHRFDDVNISEREFDILLDIVSWKRTPKFPRRGRMAWHILDEPASVPAFPDLQLRAAKIKGIGAYNPPDDGRYRDPLLDYFIDAPIQPTTEPLDSFVTYPHVGIDKEGEFMWAYGSISPVGGIVHDRALREFQMAKILVEHRVPTIVPLVVVQYEERLTFNEQPMGAVISLLPNTAPYRLSEIQYGAAIQPGEDPDKDAYCREVQDSLGVAGDLTVEETRLEVINLLARKVGKLIRDFTAAGLYRYSPEWSNFEYDCANQEILLTDLDSVRVMSELSPEQRRLQALRDLASVVYRTLAKFYTPSVLDKYTLTNLLEYNPLQELLMGYFSNASETKIHEATRILWNSFIPYFFIVKKYQNEIDGGWSNERRRSYKMDHDLFYLLAMTLLYPLFCESDLADIYPSSLTQTELIGKAERFLGNRYEYFVHLLNGGQ